MQNLTVAVALMMVPFPESANSQSAVAATNAERESGFETRADCEKALGGVDLAAGKVAASDQTDSRGSVFNRAAGNISRCELIEGEIQLVVYPAGSQAADTQ